MITEEDILSLGFEKIDSWCSDVIVSYKYSVRRYDKGRDVYNIYRLDRYIDTDYFMLQSDLERLPDLRFLTRGFNGELETVGELFDIFEFMKEENRKH